MHLCVFVCLFVCVSMYVCGLTLTPPWYTARGSARRPVSSIPLNMFTNVWKSLGKKQERERGKEGAKRSKGSEEEQERDG